MTVTPAQLLDNELILAAWFDQEFSIDWLLDISDSKASKLIGLLEDEVRQGTLLPRGHGKYIFKDEKRKRELRKKLSAVEKEDYHRKIANVDKVANSDTTVLILGGTGVGKELVASAIHRGSQRNDKPFIRVHCSALPETLISSELFGHENGVFTGAISRRIGRFELANGGTLFLDEIGELPMEVQVRLLRILQTREDQW